MCLSQVFQSLNIHIKKKIRNLFLISQMMSFPKVIYDILALTLDQWSFEEIFTNNRAIFFLDVYYCWCTYASLISLTQVSTPTHP